MDKAEIERYLAEFARDPRAVMTREPPKRDVRGRPTAGPTAFDRASIEARRYVDAHDAARLATRAVVGGAVVTLEEALAGRAPIAAADRPEDLVDKLRYKKPADMDAAGLAKAELPEMPWSDDYWAVYLGVLGNRYADPDFPASDSWKENHAYIQANPFLEFARKGAEAVDRLSPSEKYDLLVGDARGTLTQSMWNEGRSYQESKGEVEKWMGICHGWAPASYMIARPRREVVVKAADGVTDLRFYPDDIKALCSLLWANAGTPVRFIGTRSEDKEPKLDENGRAKEQSAFDTNPGTWHIAMVNQIGVARRSMVMDATYDYEVWNQPIYSYEYHYFNPQTMAFAATLAAGTVTRGAFTKDRFAKYRSEDYASIVGVAMRTRYVGETSPTHEAALGDEKDALVTVDYYYDLELDDDGTILGGEWYLNRHPDFLWTPAPKARAVTPADAYATGSWDGSSPMPASWRAAAVRAAAQSLPLAKVVEQLVRLANA